mmetsp:Transcript_65571/g.185991  ORF Transcript_65571/g.185991 Transcript_65571/m.185991 type:complete len:228 (-) Transcript_65571:347-1030(-)
MSYERSIVRPLWPINLVPRPPSMCLLAARLAGSRRCDVGVPGQHLRGADHGNVDRAPVTPASDTATQQSISKRPEDVELAPQVGHLEDDRQRHMQVSLVQGQHQRGAKHRRRPSRATCRDARREWAVGARSACSPSRPKVHLPAGALPARGLRPRHRCSGGQRASGVWPRKQRRRCKGPCRRWRQADLRCTALCQPVTRPALRAPAGHNGAEYDAGYDDQHDQRRHG